jgi:hypothetical protein
MATIRVLKSFVFTPPPERRSRVPTEMKFRTGPNREPVDVTIPDNHPLLTHPWYLDDHCDGCVESPEQAKARVDRERAALAASVAQNTASLAQAQAAVDRMQNAGKSILGSKEEQEEELNTPIPELRARQNAKRAASIDASGGVKAAS